jgi:mono/diheme cytochrome c family protein
MSVTLRLLILLGALHGLAVVATAAEDLAAGGQQLVEANCARCHAIGKTGTSPFAPAPPFREVAMNYTQEELVDGFMEGLAVRHKAMPDWVMTMEQAEAIAAYILSIPPTDNSPAAAGHDIMSKNCARCHNIEATGNSPLAKAPTFRDVMKRYDASNLEEALAEGIVTGHNEMPEFTFEADQIAAIVAYLSTLQKK